MMTGGLDYSGVVGSYHKHVDRRRHAWRMDSLGNQYSVRYRVFTRITDHWQTMENFIKSVLARVTFKDKVNNNWSWYTLCALFWKGSYVHWSIFWADSLCDDHMYNDIFEFGLKRQSNKNINIRLLWLEETFGKTFASAISSFQFKPKMLAPEMPAIYFESKKLSQLIPSFR